MKKITLFLMACTMSVMAFAQGGSITYNLNGGVTNDYGWQNKVEMLEAFCADWNALKGSSLSWGAETKPGDIFSATYTETGRFSAELLVASSPKWGWLHSYVIKVATDANHASLSALNAGGTSNDTYWRGAIDGFFTNSQANKGVWNEAPNFSLAGDPVAFMPTWKHGFAGPATYDGTKEIILPIPYKDGESFLGWFDNAGFTGTKVTSIPVGASGNKTYWAKFGEYIPTIKEVQDKPTAVATKTAGFVSYISGTTAYIQDATGALKVEFATAPTTIARFNRITISGTTAKEGIYAKLTGAALEEREATTAKLAAGSVALTGLEAYMFTYIFIEGVKITAISGNDVTLSKDGNSVTLTLTSAPTKTVGTEVNVNAVVVAADKLVGIDGDVVLKPAAKPDPYNYPAIGNLKLNGPWMYSNTLGNFSANAPGLNSAARGMAVKDGKMYFADRSADGKRLIVVDGTDGTKLAPIALAANVFADAMGYHCQDTQVDNAGNLLVSNMITSVGGRFQVWKIDVTTGNGTVVVNEVLADNPDYKNLSVRLDYFGVYGDVNSDAIIMATTETGNVFKWTITGGVCSPAELIILDTATPPGANPRIYPISNEFFYTDGFATTPVLYDMDGTVIDGFQNYTGIKTNFKVENNGVREFDVAGNYFLIMAQNNNPMNLALFKFKDAYKDFSQMEFLWTIPNAGVGNASLGYRTAIASVEVSGTKAAIYFYIGENGYGRYDLDVNYQGITNPNGSSIAIIGGKGEIQFVGATSAQVFSVTGQLVAESKGAAVAVNPGIYVVKAAANGETAVKKVIVQ